MKLVGDPRVDEIIPGGPGFIHLIYAAAYRSAGGQNRGFPAARMQIPGLSAAPGKCRCEPHTLCAGLGVAVGAITETVLRQEGHRCVPYGDPGAPLQAWRLEHTNDPMRISPGKKKG